MKWDAGKLYCNTVIVLQLGRAGWQELYHNTLHCIMAETLAVGRIVSQYSSLYCDRGKAWTVLQYSHRAHDTAKLGAGQGAGRAAGRAGRAGRRWGLGAGAAGAPVRAGVQARAGAGKRARARLAQAGRRCVGQAAATRGARGAGSRGATGRSRRAAWALGARPGRAAWLRAVHSVHSACFRFGLTRYCS